MQISLQKFINDILFLLGEFSTGSQEDMAFDEMSLDEDGVAAIGSFADESPSHEVRKLLRNLNFNPKHVKKHKEKGKISNSI
jgi:hypothetical protein